MPFGVLDLATVSAQHEGLLVFAAVASGAIALQRLRIGLPVRALGRDVAGLLAKGARPLRDIYHWLGTLGYCMPCVPTIESRRLFALALAFAIGLPVASLSAFAPAFALLLADY